MRERRGHGQRVSDALPPPRGRPNAGPRKDAPTCRPTRPRPSMVAPTPPPGGPSDRRERGSAVQAAVVAEDLAVRAKIAGEAIVGAACGGDAVPAFHCGSFACPRGASRPDGGSRVASARRNAKRVCRLSINTPSLSMGCEDAACRIAVGALSRRVPSVLQKSAPPGSRKRREPRRSGRRDDRWSASTQPPRAPPCRSRNASRICSQQ
jgi:hypothetical protein